MKLSLDTVGYGGYFTKDFEKLSLEDAIKKAAEFGYDAACIFAHRPLGFPIDFDSERRKKLKDLYDELGLEVGAVVCCNNFVEGNHVFSFNTEKEIMYTKQCIDFAAEIGSKIVRVMASFWGYFQNPNAGQGYGLPSFECRSRRVSRGEDFLEAWHQVREALTEVAKYAEEKNITLALQTHPEITGNNDETLQMIEEVNIDSLKLGLDLPLMESYQPQDVKAIVKKMAKYIVYSHTISLVNHLTVGGAPYSWEEVTPGSDEDPLPWEIFLQSLMGIGYDGFLSAEQCSPIVVKGHQLGSLKVVDERYIDSRNYFRKLLKKLNCYTGNKPDYIQR